MLSYHYQSIKITNIKKEMLIIPSAVKDMEKLENSHILVCMEDDTVTLENSLTGSYNVKHILTILISATSKLTLMFAQKI